MFKNIFITVVSIFILTASSYAANHYGCTALNGGASGALDALDITGATDPNADNLADGDSAMVTTISGTTVKTYFFVFDADGTSAESSPDVIRPDDYDTAGVWRLCAINTDQDVSTSASPAFAHLTLTGENTLSVGTSSSYDGSILFKNATNSNAFTITSGITGAAIGWILPTAAPGGANYLLTVDADGTMGYTDPSTLGSGFSITDITGQTDDSTPATTATLVLAQSGSLIESTVQQIVDAGLAAPAAIGSGTPAAGTFTTFSAGAGGAAIDAEGNATFKSLTVSKASGVAGLNAVYEANSTDTSYIALMGPVSIPESWSGQWPDAQPAGQVPSFAAPAGSGDPNGNKVSAISWVTPTVAADWDTWAEHPALTENYFLIGNGSNQAAASTAATALGILKNADADIWQSVSIAVAGLIADGTNCTDPASEAINSGPNVWFSTCSDAAGTLEVGIPMPENWDGGNIYVELIVGSNEASPSGTVEFEIQAQARGAGEAINSTWLSTVVAQFGSAIDTQYAPEMAESAVIACSGAGGDILYIKATRDNDDGTNDTSTQAVEVWGMRVYYQIDDLDERD